MSHAVQEGVRWLLSEYKEHIKVTRLEYELLKFISKKGYKYLARDSLGSLCVYTLKPHRDVKVWKTNMKYLWGRFAIFIVSVRSMGKLRAYVNRRRA